MSDDRPQEGFVRRLLFYQCARDLAAGRTESTLFLNDRKLTVPEIEKFVTYARQFGFLPDRK